MASNYITYSDSLITQCESALSTSWRKPQLQLTRRDKKLRGTYYCEIDTTSASNTNFLMESKSNSAMPLPVLAIQPFVVANAFFFGIRLRFDHEFDNTYALTSASIHVFSGPNLSPVVRAEWDRRDVGKTQHAQPHWHLLASPSTSMAGQTSIQNSQVQEFQASANPSPIEVEKIHFPISAPWQQTGNGAPFQHQFNQAADLVNWIIGLTSYLGNQLVYVASKSPRAPALPVATEFRPASSV